MISTIVRTAIIYFTVTFAIRMMGKRQIGDMQPNELVITLLISEIAAIPLQDVNQPIINGIIAIFCLIILEIIISVLTMKNITVRKLMSGKSVIIIKNGSIDCDAMKKVRMTVLDLIELLRQQNVFNISEVDFAILEVNGSLSVLKKSGYENVTLNDMSIKPSATSLPLPVISDGNILYDSLYALGVSENEFKGILTARSVKPNEIFLMTLDGIGNINLIRKDAMN